MYLEDDISTCLTLFYDYVEENPNSVILPDFEQVMINDVEELVKNDKEEEYIQDVMDVSLEIFYETLYPSRSFPNSFCQNQSNKEKIIIQNKLDKIHNTEQPQQKTNEWYTTRQGLLTASNAYKMFDSQCQQNSLIYEKCKPKSIEDMNPKNINTESSLHWGNKYEPLSVLLYEDIYKTKVGEYGFLPHKTHFFLGASPDGINIDYHSDRFGRMLEIKNIVNREINGIPKKEYWVQMQLQMEVFDLNECDFLETRFIEYENEVDFLRDSDDSIFVSKNQERKGIILYFSDSNTGNPFYIYTPLHITYSEYELWSDKIIQETIENNPSLFWVRQIYWKLDEISCVLVKRNKHWFQHAIPIMAQFWNTIQKEKINGYDHRAPKNKK